MGDRAASGVMDSQASSAPRSVAAGSMTALLEEIIASAQPSLPGEGEPQPGERIGRFDVLREIGRGGFGVVYEARDETLGRLVALKLLKPGRSRTELGARWLVEEAEAAAQLQHPNIVALFDLGSYGGKPYLVLELLRGETLAQRLERGPLPPESALEIATQIARGLAHAHARGVLLRDLKPGNVFLCEDGTVKLLDFGLSRLIGVAGSKGGGTPAYMAPEQWRGEEEDARADVFALGVLLHHALAGDPPWAVQDGRSAVLDPGPTPRLSAAPRPMADLVERMIEREPARRPANGAAALDALLALGARTQRGRARRVTVGIGLAIVASLGAAGWWHATHRGSARADPIRVAVADLLNETGEPELDALSGLLITSLEQSRRLHVLTRGRMLDLLKQVGAAGERVDEAAARKVGRAAGVEALLVGSVRRFGEVYSLEMRALDPDRDEYLFAAKADGRGKESIPGLVDAVAETARVRLHEARADIAASVLPTESVTSNLDAYRHYFKGQELETRADLDRARLEFERALEIDPRFALARHEISMIMRIMGDPESQVRTVLGEVARDRDRLPDKERALHDAYATYMRGEWDAARSRVREVAWRYPDEKWFLVHAGYLLGWDLGNWSEALPLFERAFELDPGFDLVAVELTELIAVVRGPEEVVRFTRARAAAQPSNLTFAALYEASEYQGDFGGMEAAARRWFELDGKESTGPARAVATAKYLQDDYAGARAWFDREQIGRRSIPLMRAVLLVAEGRFREAIQAVDRLGEAAYGRFDDTYVYVNQQSAALLAGIAPCERFRREGRRCFAEENYCGDRLAPVAAAAGDMEFARELLAAASSPGRSAFARKVLTAYELLAKNDGAGAIALLRDSAGHHPRDNAMLEHARATACFASGDHACAVEAYRRFVKSGVGLWHDEGPWRAWAYPQALYREALSLGRLGRLAEARARVEHLLRLWKNADSDLPLLHDARALRARLASAR